MKNEFVIKRTNKALEVFSNSKTEKAVGKYNKDKYFVVTNWFLVDGKWTKSLHFSRKRIEPLLDSTYFESMEEFVNKWLKKNSDFSNVYEFIKWYI